MKRTFFLLVSIVFVISCSSIRTKGDKTSAQKQVAKKDTSNTQKPVQKSIAPNKEQVKSAPKLLETR